MITLLDRHLRALSDAYELQGEINRMIDELREKRWSDVEDSCDDIIPTLAGRIAADARVLAKEAA